MYVCVCVCDTGIILFPPKKNLEKVGERRDANIKENESIFRSGGGDVLNQYTNRQINWTENFSCRLSCFGEKVTKIVSGVKFFFSGKFS